ncbi:MAG: galactokinase [Oscillospiraceae bacterium]|nr:galactokinase [Oscillospiraceae bacterium]
MGNPISVTELYPSQDLKEQRERYRKAIDSYREYFGGIGDGYRIFSAPGRTEVGGNHTDHNHGKVLAASVNLDVIAIVEPIEVPKIALKSEGYDESIIEIEDTEVKEQEKNTSEALIRGVVAGFRKNGYKVGGFKAYTTTNVLKGSGLSSSAAFEVLVGNILNHLYNDGGIGAIKIAQIAQYAENEYFGKPSGLMDQTASSVGGFVAIDFKDIESPIIEKINSDFTSYDHALCIIDTKGSHADLTPDYAAIPAEMKQIAEHFSVQYLRQLCREDIMLNMDILRDEFGDRAVLRALHFFEENERVDRLSHALRSNDFKAFLDSIRESGNSSYKYLQNIFSVNDIKNQGLGIGLNAAERVLGRKGACRVHGGGFAGTIQAFVPLDLLKEFKMSMETLFGAGSCYVLTIRKHGGVEVDRESLAEPEEE